MNKKTHQNVRWVGGGGGGAAIVIQTYDLKCCKQIVPSVYTVLFTFCCNELIDPWLH